MLHLCGVPHAAGEVGMNCATLTLSITIYTHTVPPTRVYHWMRWDGLAIYAQSVRLLKFKRKKARKRREEEEKKL